LEQKFGANSKVAAAAAPGLLFIRNSKQLKPKLRNKKNCAMMEELQKRAIAKQKTSKKQKRWPHPEQISMVALVGNQQLSTAGDHPRSNQRVASQTKEP
jgi:hypothetical protein